LVFIKKRPTSQSSGLATLTADFFEAMQEKIELLQDIQTSITQVEGGHGIEHDDAKATVLKRIRQFTNLKFKEGEGDDNDQS
jgi:hypothetical protein